MASKGPRSKLDHDSRARRQKVLEAPKEPKRPKTHWDHVLEEMIWLSKDFESERKWKLGQAKKVAVRASKGMMDQATRGERRIKEEEQKLRKLALNISKDVKKFWAKIEKLVSYKHQLELDVKKKKALDKQLEFLLGQTERYSTMLAENLVNTPSPCKPFHIANNQDRPSIPWKTDEDIDGTSGSDAGSLSNVPSVDGDYSLQSDEKSEDDENTIEEDEAHITHQEREEELAALHNEIDLPLEEILKRYVSEEVKLEKIPGTKDNVCELGPELIESNGKLDFIKCDNKMESVESPKGLGCHGVKSNGVLSISENHSLEIETYKRTSSSKKLTEAGKNLFCQDFDDEQEDDDFVLSLGEKEDEMDDETTLIEEEELANNDSNSAADEIALLQRESEIPMDELLARYNKGGETDEYVENCSEYSYTSGSDEFMDSQAKESTEFKLTKNESITLKSDIRSNLPDEDTECLGNSGEAMESEDIIADAAAAARSAQPTGNTFSTTKVRTKFPFLIKYPLREYQHIGLDWLVTMYEKRLNGILADEMGLGKTIMTIALLAHLACEKGIWGPHLIVVPTSVMLNWETEFLKWCPAFKILTYFGSAKERRMKRQGWLKPNSFHVCITTYRLVIQDCKVFKRKKWKYLILDEAHLIKNWKSQRWQTLLNFNSKRRILLTGTPLQNDLMELWSLMHFLMPHIFQSHQEFKDWFSNPISVMVEGQEKINKDVVDRLHNVLRPFILRRLKRDVEKQLPIKHEHVISCRLSRRQRNLYEDFISSSETQATLSSSNFFGMISVIMQLRKVCNHPDLFEGRPIVSSFDMSGIDMQMSSSVCSMLVPGVFSVVDLFSLGFVFTHLDFCTTLWEGEEIQTLATPSSSIKHSVIPMQETSPLNNYKLGGASFFEEIQKALVDERLKELMERAETVAWWNSLRCKKKPIYGIDLQELVTIRHPVYDMQSQKNNPLSYLYSSKLADILLSPVERFGIMVDLVESFMFAIPAARAPPPVCWCSKGVSTTSRENTLKDKYSEVFFPLLTPFRPAIIRGQVYFPDRRLIQFDCGKLQELATLLRKLKSEGHRALIFTQMTKMLDILETFINLYGYTYMRLDGSTPPEERQTLMQRFNTNPKIFLFILSTRSGGVGINLVGADTVIFYDSDWNPAMDQQAQDRCHRIGQTREVHIYRLVSESTIEENILKKANQKRALDNLVIQSGSYDTEFLKKLNPLELFADHQTIPIEDVQTSRNVNNAGVITLSTVDLEAALKNAEDEADYMALKKVEEEEAVDNQEFTEEALGKLEDDEFANEEDLKLDDTVEHCELNAKSDEGYELPRNCSIKECPVKTVEEEDVEMLNNVKQMAAAAAATPGQAILSFENQLRPIDRYAIHFLELWDPIRDKAIVESQVLIQETEWELDHIEKLKDDMEAEIDDDEEPLVYERWDADFATEVYRQQVEALAQHQLIEDMEREAREKDALECQNSDPMRNEISVTAKTKSKKKAKKAKFKSLKKGTLVSKSLYVKTESSVEPVPMDDDLSDDEMITSPVTLSPSPVREKKRKAASYDQEVNRKSNSKKLKPFEPRNSNDVVEPESKQLSKGRTRGQLFISVMPLKRVFTLKQEKLKKKRNIWSKDYFPSPDQWSPREDAVLCSVVHEYGPNWNLASEIIYRMTDGGFYRGRFRHPVHCSERFRELIQRHVLSVNDVTNCSKSVNVNSGKAPLRVTEDNIQILLSIASELPDHEPLLQKHFFAVLYAAWRHLHQPGIRKNTLSTQNEFYSPLQHRGSTINYKICPERSKVLESSRLYQCGVLVAAALNGDCSHQTDDALSSLNQWKGLPMEIEQLDITLELQGERDEITPLPSAVDLSILGSDPFPFLKMHPSVTQNFKTSWSLVENRLRATSAVCAQNSLGAESQGVPYGDSSSWSSRFHLLGKQSTKPLKSKSRRASMDNTYLHSSVAHVSLPQAEIPTDSVVASDEVSSWFPELEFSSYHLLDMDDDISFRGPLDSIPFHSVSDSTSDLDDLSILPEFTDIG